MQSVTCALMPSAPEEGSRPYAPFGAYQEESFFLKKSGMRRGDPWGRKAKGRLSNSALISHGGRDDLPEVRTAECAEAPRQNETLPPVRPALDLSAQGEGRDMNAAALTLRMSHLDTLYRLGRMSPFEAWLWGLCDEPTGKRDARPKHPPLNDVALPGPVAVRPVDALGHVRGVAPGDQRSGLVAVHDDQRQAETLQPVAEEGRDAPRDPAPIAPIGGLELGRVAVGETQPVIELLLGDAESLPPAPQQGDELLFIPHGDRLHAHVEPHNPETPHG